MSSAIKRDAPVETEGWGARPGARPTALTSAGLTIGQVSQRTGIPAKTIRYYESIGLLPAPPRGANTYRRYSQGDVNRLLLLRRIKLLGVPLAGAQHLLESATDARCVDAQEELLSLVDSRLSALDRQIAELHALRAQVNDYRDALAACHTDDMTPFADCADMRCIGAPPDELTEDGATDVACCPEQPAIMRLTTRDAPPSGA